VSLTKEQLYEALVEGGGVTKEEFLSASRSRDAKRDGIDGVLVSRGVLADLQIGQLIADYYSVPFISISKTNVKKDIIKLIPESFARKQHVFPIEKKGEEITIAVSDPSNATLSALLEKYLRGNVNLVYATKNDLDGAMYLFQKDPEEALKSIIDATTGDQGSRVVNLVSTMIDYAYQTSASDIHIEPEEDYTMIRYRIDGVLKDIYEMPKQFHEYIISRIKVLAKLAIDEHRAAQDGKIRHRSIWGDKIDIRVSIVPTTNGEKVVMRLLAEKSRQFSLTDLGFSEEDLEKLQAAIKRPWGMILVTGPTGSGKSTSLYAALKLLNKREVNIATIEDPVEYDITGVNQIQVNAKTDLTFAKGLRSIVRQDPDIIMVGEIRDKETAQISVNAAMTGHLVLSTLHTNDSATAFPRLEDMSVEDFLISSTVIVVLAQRLVRRICLACIESFQIDSADEKLLKNYPQVVKYLEELSGKKKLTSIRVFKGKGCPVCHNTGYTGRTGVFEVLNVTDAIREAIMQGKDADSIRDISVKEGMTTMLHDGVKKVLTGITTIEEILRVTQE